MIRPEYPYKIDEDEIVNWALKRLPDINSIDTKMVIVYVNDFIGETNVIAQSRYYAIDLHNGKSIIVDRKDKTHVYYVIFQKRVEKGKLIWDLVGYDKREILSNPRA